MPFKYRTKKSSANCGMIIKVYSLVSAAVFLELSNVKSIVLLLQGENMVTAAKIGPKLLVSGNKPDLVLMKYCSKHHHKNPQRSTLSHLSRQSHTDWYDVFDLKLIYQCI